MGFIFGIECIPQEVLNKIKDKSINHSILGIQDNESIMCRFYCIAFIEYMLWGKTLLDYTNLFSPNDYKKNDKKLCKYFKDKFDRNRNMTYFSLNGYRLRFNICICLLVCVPVSITSSAVGIKVCAITAGIKKYKSIIKKKKKKHNKIVLLGKDKYYWGSNF